MGERYYRATKEWTGPCQVARARPLLNLLFLDTDYFAQQSNAVIDRVAYVGGRGLDPRASTCCHRAEIQVQDINLGKLKLR